MSDAHSDSDDDLESLDEALLARYLASECSARDLVRLQQWIDAAPGRRQLLETLHATGVAWQAQRPRATDSRFAWARLERRLGRTPVTRAARRFTIPWAVIAAAVVIALGALAPLTRWRPWARSVTYQTGIGERRTLTLTDGSRVTIAPTSKMRVTGRDVFLDGEAYLVVVHDPRRPFVVHTVHGRMTDLGTRFDVRSYATDTCARVVVDDGAVSVISTVTGASAALSADEMVSVGRGGALSAVSRVDPARFLDWTGGRLVARDLTVRELLPELRRWYGLDIVTDTVLEGRHITGTWSNEPPDQVVHELAELLDARVSRDRGRVLLSARGNQ